MECLIGDVFHLTTKARLLTHYLIGNKITQYHHQSLIDLFNFNLFVLIFLFYIIIKDCLIDFDGTHYSLCSHIEHSKESK